MKCLNCGNTEMFSVSMSQSFYCLKCSPCQGELDDYENLCKSAFTNW